MSAIRFASWRLNDCLNCPQPQDGELQAQLISVVTQGSNLWFSVWTARVRNPIHLFELPCDQLCMDSSRIQTLERRRFSHKKFVDIVIISTSSIKLTITQPWCSVRLLLHLLLPLPLARLSASKVCVPTSSALIFLWMIESNITYVSLLYLYHILWNRWTRRSQARRPAFHQICCIMERWGRSLQGMHECR